MAAALTGFRSKLYGEGEGRKATLLILLATFPGGGDASRQKGLDVIDTCRYILYMKAYVGGWANKRKNRREGREHCVVCAERETPPN